MALKVDRALCCCFSGHRPEKLRRDEMQIKGYLGQAIVQAIAQGYQVFIIGMARGTDLWAGEILLRIRETNPKIKIVAALPYQGFDDNWKRESRQLYQKILRRADHVEYISPAYNRSCFQKRNEWMVDHSNRLIAVFDGIPGGTKNTIQYAAKAGIEMCII